MVGDVSCKDRKCGMVIFVVEVDDRFVLLRLVVFSIGVLFVDGFKFFLLRRLLFFDGKERGYKDWFK